LKHFLSWSDASDYRCFRLELQDLYSRVRHTFWPHESAAENHKEVFAVQDSAYRSLTAQTTTCLQGKASGRPETPSQRRPETTSLNCDNRWNLLPQPIRTETEPKNKKQKHSSDLDREKYQIRIRRDHLKMKRKTWN
jgi:hypothetical protein